jgi:hypothetical protein
METQLFVHGAVALNRIVYVVGGATNIGYPTPLPSWTGAYDPRTNTWSKKAHLNDAAPYPCTSCSYLPPGRCGAGVVESGGKIYVVGGGTGNGSVPGTEVYDPATDTWSDKAQIPTARQSLTAQAVNGVIYAIGGMYGRQDNHAYNIASNTWSTKASMPTGRTGPGSAAVNGLIYVIGGQTAAGDVLATVEAYDPSTDKWTTKTPMPTPRVYPAVAVVNGIIYAIGGQKADESTLQTVEAYNPGTDKWTTETPMPTSRSQFAAAAVDGVIYAMGGITPRWTVFAVNEAFTPASTCSYSISPAS